MAARAQSIRKKGTRGKNPRNSSDSMFESFHGEPSDETIVYQDEEHYHSNVAALGVLVEMRVKLVGGGTAVIGFDEGNGDQTNNPYNDQNRKQNPFWPFNSFTKSTIYHVGTGEKYTVKGSHKGYKVYQDNNTGNFLVPKLDSESRFDTKKDATKFVDYWTKARPNPLHPQLVGGYDYGDVKEKVKGLRPGDAVKVVAGSERFWVLVTSVSGSQITGTVNNQLVNKDLHGLKFGDKISFSKSKVADVDKLSSENPGRGKKHHTGPFHEAGRLLGKTTQGMSKPVDDFTGAVGKVGGYLDDQLGRVLNPKSYKDTGPVMLCSSEDGLSLYIFGGNQSLDLRALGLDGDWERDSMVIGDIKNLVYRTRKKFDKLKEIDYTHRVGEETGDLPILRYSLRDKRLFIDGGRYRVEDVGIVN